MIRHSAAAMPCRTAQTVVVLSRPAHPQSSVLHAVSAARKIRHKGARAGVVMENCTMTTAREERAWRAVAGLMIIGAVMLATLLVCLD